MPFTKLRIFLPLAALALSAAIIPLAPALSAPPAEQSAQVDQAITALRAVSTMRADFLQTDRNGQRLTGVMTLQRPGKIRFQYQKGVPLLIVSDGAALTLIDYEVRQVQRWPIRNSPLGALLDPNKDVAKFARPIATGNPAVLSMEIKDPRHPEYGTITMIMVKSAAAPGGFALDSWISFDAQAKRTTVRLTNQQYGVAVPANMFRWNDPRLPTRR